MPVKAQLFAAIILNIIFSSGAGCLVKQGTGGNFFWWVALAVLVNSFGFVALAWAIKVSGLGLGTAIALLSTIALNAVIGFAFFHEALSYKQSAGIVLSIISIYFMLFG